MKVVPMSLPRYHNGSSKRIKIWMRGTADILLHEKSWGSRSGLEKGQRDTDQKSAILLMQENCCPEKTTKNHYMICLNTISSYIFIQYTFLKM
uniref:Uncharacterized protein n=1 Tax=Lepeophtheirus salmonis TaxID=72036 RepID=A0A0K2TSJ2_LEPSM